MIQCTEIVSKFTAIISELIHYKKSDARVKQWATLSRTCRMKLRDWLPLDNPWTRNVRSWKLGQDGHLVGLPEDSEGPVLRMDLLGLGVMAGFDRAHRTLRAKPMNGEPSCQMIIRITQFQLSNDILHRAGQCSPLFHQEKSVHLLTLAVAKLRAAIIKVKRRKLPDPDKASEFMNKTEEESTCREWLTLSGLLICVAYTTDFSNNTTPLSCL